MRRRALLAEAAGVTGGMAGCLSGGESQETVIGEDDPTVTDTSTATPTETAVSDQQSTLPALRWYPSALLPPVSEPYLFHWYSGSNTQAWVESTSGQGRASTSIRGEMPLAQHGMLPLKWFGGPQTREGFDDARDAYLRMAKRYQRQLDDKHRQLGIAVDEWQGGPGDGVAQGAVEGSIEGIRQATRIAPELFIGVYWRGETSLDPLLEEGLVDLAMIESVHFERANRARDELAYLDRTILLAGYTTNSLDGVKKQIRRTRENYPKMPGFGIYDPGIDDLPDNTWAVQQEIDSAFRKHFVDPAPDVSLTRPTYAEPIRDPTVTIEAEATPKGGRSIREYRWFVDNRLVEKTQEPAYEWDTTRVASGHHVLTVHAIDDGWNRAATQIPVELRVGGDT